MQKLTKSFKFRQHQGDEHYLDGRPIRGVFRSLDTRGKRTLIRYLTGSTLTRTLLGVDCAACPACGEPDTVAHRTDTCWVSRSASLPCLRREAEGLLEDQLGLPYFTWTERRPDELVVTFWENGVEVPPFRLNAADSDLFVDGSMLNASYPWCATMGAAVVQPSKRRALRIVLERSAIPSSTVAEFVALIVLLHNHVDPFPGLEIKVATDSMAMV